MHIVWDENKRQSNIDKHGFDFADVVEVDWENAVINSTHDNRFKAIGRLYDRTVVVIYALLGTEAISIISFRAAKASERKVLK